MVRQRSDSANSSDSSDSQGPRAQVVTVVSSDEVAWYRLQIQGVGLGQFSLTWVSLSQAKAHGLFQSSG